MDAIGGIIYSCIPWNKKNGGQKAQSRQWLASEKQHQDTKGSRIGSKTNRPTMIRTKPDFLLLNQAATLVTSS
ncbi:MAG TPA: hypothetical protein VIP53_02840 [Nitrososphaera sp.]